ncbi:MAG: YqgE/AlgH family protein [Paracoccaceae bacterium]|nr:YqgE/AlgH family protein [Paracoccaceae bacterium]
MELAGKLLVAMPGMGDPRFEKSVVFVCAHSEDGAMGLIVNKPAPDLTMDALLEQLNIPSGESSKGIRVHFGGPVEHGRGFVLHSADYTSKDATLNVDERFRMTATQDILEAISRGSGPEESMLMLGYAGWGPGQLESEIVRNGWLITDAEPGLVFSNDAGMKWSAALKTLGVDPVSLSSTGGRA